MPALPSSAARIPPAAPTPTMTASVFSVAISSRPPPGALVLGLDAGDWRAREGLPALKIARREKSLRAGKAHQAPAREIPVPAVDRVSEHALHGVSAKSVEELLRGRPRESSRLAFVECCNRLVLFGRVELHEGLLIGFAAVGVELSEPAPVEILKIGVSAREREIDIVENSSVACARPAWRARHQALGERRDRGGLFFVKERASLRTRRVR